MTILDNAIILNKNNAFNSFEKDLTDNFESGIFMVNKIMHDDFLGVFQWVYVYRKEGEFNLIINDDLTKLKNIVINNGFIWKIIDNTRFNDSLKENSFNLKQIDNKKWHFTGIHRVYKRKEKRVSQGFLWTYRFKHAGNTIELSSTDLNELKEKILKNNFEWIILDEDIAGNSFKENSENFEKYGFSTNKNKTGIYRVFKLKNDSKQGFDWVFSQIIDKKQFSFHSVNLLKLKQKVLDNGFEWIIIDEKLAEKSFNENEKNMKKYYR